METEPKKYSASEIADQLVQKYQLTVDEEVIFLRAILELGGMGEEEDWEKSLQRLGENQKVKEAFKEFAKKTD